MILIAYDGSDDARAAIDAAGKLLSGQEARVVTAWQRFIDALARSGTGVPLMVDYESIDAGAQDAAKERAVEGAGLANAAGFKAEPLTVAVESTIAEAVLHTAADLNADAIVMGSRGLTGIKSALLGSVSHHVVQHADRPVIVIPSPAVGEKRAAQRD